MFKINICLHVILLNRFLSGEFKLQPGTYNYTFQCLLPAGLPTSVEGDHGFIRYSATVNLDRPMWPDQEFEEGFTVIKPLNLNVMPHLRVSIKMISI